MIDTPWGLYPDAQAASVALDGSTDNAGVVFYAADGAPFVAMDCSDGDDVTAMWLKAAGADNAQGCHEPAC